MTARTTPGQVEANCLAGSLIQAKEWFRHGAVPCRTAIKPATVHIHGCSAYRRVGRMATRIQLTKVNRTVMDGRVLPDEISYERWIRYVFDHPVLRTAWWWHGETSEHYEVWNEEADPGRTLEFLTRFFQHPEEVLGPYTAAQIDQGLNLLVSSSCSNTMFCLLDTGIPWERRRVCIEAMVPCTSG